MHLLHLLVVWPVALSSCAPLPEIISNEWPTYGRKVNQWKVWGALAEKFAPAIPLAIAASFLHRGSKPERAASRYTNALKREENKRLRDLEKNPKPKTTPKPKYKATPDTPNDVHKQNLDSKGHREVDQCTVGFLQRFTAWSSGMGGTPPFSDAELNLFNLAKAHDLTIEQIRDFFNQQCLTWHKRKESGTVLNEKPAEAPPILSPAPAEEGKQLATAGSNQFSVNQLANGLAESAKTLGPAALQAAPYILRTAEPVVRAVVPGI
ncbi:MAG: hypothetical protein M1823_005717 [Watsoniomyces obsoletus]|nr:MAG: hypothetical protein M1823_005717 [Watsoniomyces obsoletus]